MPGLMMEKIISFTRRHWKKIGIASMPVLYGINYIKSEYQISQHMRQICNNINQYPVHKNCKVLVVLNPVANKKQSEKKFKKYCEPVLHMAGYEVEVIKTKHIGHAKSLMETLSKLPDIVVVAGGDGTSSEVVTGLIRKNTQIVCPILFLPLGEKNDIAHSLMRLDYSSGFVQNVSKCMLALVQGRIEHRPVIKYELIENDQPRKPIFGVHAFSWGILKDIEINSEKYWYFGSLKHYVSAIITSLSNKLNKNIAANILCTPPCPGCNKCEMLAKNKSWFNVSKLFNPHPINQPAKEVEEQKLCSTEKCYNISAKQIDIKCTQNSKSFFALNTYIIDNISSRSDFLINVMKENKQSSTTLESRTIEVIPVQSEHETYYIDGESYDARHIKISILPNALKYFF